MRSLEGIRVLDLSRLLPGPFATMVLGDLGAEVHKVEDLGAGDYLRHMPPLIGDQSAMFLALNRNKKSLCVDLKRPEGQRLLLRLLPRYDVLFEQFRPGVLDRLGLGSARLLAENPRLVVCSLTGYGQDGPLAKRAGHDLNYLARAGLLGLQGPTDGPPTVPGFQLADVGGGLWSVIGVLAALMEREKTGRGRVVDVAMVEAAMGFAIAALGSLSAGAAPKRGDEALTGGIAPYRTYATKDGKYVSLAALEPKFWLTFTAAVGLEADLGALLPGPHQRPLVDAVQAIFLGKTRSEWEAFGAEHDCCIEPVLEPSELPGDPQLVARGVFYAAESPWGALTQWRTPVATRGDPCTPPPRAGAHTDAVLRDAGLSNEEIAELRRAKAVR